MRFVNMTPHAIGLRSAAGTRILEPERQTLRVLTELGELDQVINGIDVHLPASFLGLSHLPDIEGGKLLIVSRLAAAVISVLDPGRGDILYPATGARSGADRDRSGVLSVRKLVRAQ